MTRVLVYGPEASRSRYAARLCATVLGIPGEYDGHGDAEDGGRLVAHRSLPYGNRDNFPSYDRLAAELGIDRCVLTCRDRLEAIRGAARAHCGGDIELAERNWNRACLEMRRAGAPTFVFSSDAVETLGPDFMVVRLAEFLDAPIPPAYEPWFVRE